MVSSQLASSQQAAPLPPAAKQALTLNLKKFAQYHDRNAAEERTEEAPRSGGRDFPGKVFNRRRDEEKIKMSRGVSKRYLNLALLTLLLALLILQHLLALQKSLGGLLSKVFSISTTSYYFNPLFRGTGARSSSMMVGPNYLPD